MSLNSHIGEIVGKRIAHVITSGNPGSSPPSHVFLVFDDNTSMEFYGSIDNAKGLWSHDYDSALKYAKGSKGEIQVYPEEYVVNLGYDHEWNSIKSKIAKSIPWILGISVTSAVIVGILYDNSITVSRFLDGHIYLFFIPLIPILLAGIVLLLDFARMALQVLFEEYQKTRSSGGPPEKALFRIGMITLLILGSFYLMSHFGG